MRLRYKVIVLGVANAFWILLLLPASLNPGLWWGTQYDQQLLFVQPQEETMQKLEANGIARDEVNQLMKFLNGTYKITDEINANLYECDERFKTGNMSRNEFIACSAFVVNYTKHHAQILAENSGPLSIINFSK